MDKKEVRKCKKTLNILQIAATDKENLSSKIHKKKVNMNNIKTSSAKKNKRSSELDSRNTVQIKNNINKCRADQSTQSHSILESDLTIDNPSENYWQKLAESCRKALDTALKENIDLHNKVNELEYENSRLKAMLDEAKTLVEVLTEMIEGKNEEVGDSNENVTKDHVSDDTKEGTSDSDMEDLSFQSCA